MCLQGGLAFAGYVPGATFPGGLPDAEPAWGESLPPLLWIGQGQGANGGLLTLVGVAFDEVAGAFRVPLGWPFSLARSWARLSSMLRMASREPTDNPEDSEAALKAAGQKYGQAIPLSANPMDLSHSQCTIVREARR